MAHIQLTHLMLSLRKDWRSWQENYQNLGKPRETTVNKANQAICVDRILVSLDSSKHSFAALQAAIQMAHHFNATIQGVFIEDTTLFGLAKMPFRQEVGDYSAIVREISSDDMSRGILVQSRWVIRTFKRLINQTDLSGNFTVLRGKVSKIIGDELENCDLLVMGKSGTNTMLKGRLGSTTKAIFRKQMKPMLLVEEGNQLGFPMIVLFENTNPGISCLETCRTLIDPDDTMIIVILDDDPTSKQSKKSFLSKWSSEYHLNISIQCYETRTLSRFIHNIKGLKKGLFLLPPIQNLSNEQMVNLFLERISLPILLIRTPLKSE